MRRKKKRAGDVQRIKVQPKVLLLPRDVALGISMGQSSSRLASLTGSSNTLDRLEFASICDSLIPFPIFAAPFNHLLCPLQQCTIGNFSPERLKVETFPWDIEKRGHETRKIYSEEYPRAVKSKCDKDKQQKTEIFLTHFVSRTIFLY